MIYMKINRSNFYIYIFKLNPMEINNEILNHQQITNKIRRIAYQIYESNSKNKDVIIAGIDKNGYILASLINDYLQTISPLKTTLCKVVIDKKNPRHPISTSINTDSYKNASIVLVDDVLNSGSTLIYGVTHFLKVPLNQFKTVVLVNRNHKQYPIKADFKGISLSTSLNEHVEVNLTETPYSAYLI